MAMDNTNTGDYHKTPRCHIEGWELLMRLSGGKSEEQWTACSDGTGEPGGIVRILKIPAYDGEADVLRENGFTDKRISRHFRECAEGELREVETVAKSEMPHIPNILKSRLVEEDDGNHRLYILSEYLLTFSEFYADRKINRATLLSLCCDICDALEEYRALGITHNNVQLENVFVTEDGRCLLGNQMPKAQLFSRLLNPSDSRLLRFIAPEVASGADFDGRADIYSLGLTMYFKFNANRLPFITSEKGMVTKSEADAAILRRLDGEAIPAPVKADEELSKIILRACAPDPADRYETATELRTAIVEYAKATGLKLSVPEVSLIPVIPDENDDQAEEENSVEMDFVAVDLADTTPENDTIETDNIVFSKNTDRKSDEISFAAFFENEDNGGSNPKTENSESLSLEETATETDSDKTQTEQLTNEDIAAANEASAETQYKDYSAESGYFDENGNFIVISTPQKTKEESEGEENSNELPSREDTEETLSENENGRRLPILKITLTIFLLVLIVIAAVISLYRCGAFGNPTGTQPSTDEQTDPVTEHITTDEAGPFIMPDLLKMTEIQAYTTLDAFGHKGSLTVTGAYSTDAEKGFVIGQTPAKDTTVSSDAAIELIVSLGAAPDTMPDVTGFAEKEASSRLSSLGYNVAVLSAYSDKFGSGQVAHQSIAASSAITAGETVYLVISLGAPPADYVAITDISIGESFTLKKGESAEMPITFEPENATEKDTWWISNAPEIVSVDNTGKITAHADGTANITVFSADGEHSAACTVTVSDNVVKVAGIGFRVKAVTMNVGDAESHAPWLTPTNVTNTYVTFSSDNPSVVTVDAYGRITAIAPGSATITARSSDGGLTASYTVTVKAPEGKTVVPSLTGSTEAEAVAMANAAGLGISVNYTVSTDVPKGTVVSQSLPAGEMIDAGASITITVSNGTSEWSDWTETAPAGNTVVESKTQWSFREKKISTQDGSPIDGWTVDTEKTVYGDWSEWNDWSTTPAIASDTVESEQKTQYRTRTVAQWSEWSTSPPYDAEGIYDIETKTAYIDQNGQPTDEAPYEGAYAVNFFRFRLKNIYGEWTEWSDTEATASASLEVETRTVYRTRTRSVTYTCYTYTEWSAWSDSEITASETTEVKTRTLYRSKVVG